MTDQVGGMGAGSAGIGAPNRLGSGVPEDVGGMGAALAGSGATNRLGSGVTQDVGGMGAALAGTCAANRRGSRGCPRCWAEHTRGSRSRQIARGGAARGRSPTVL